MRKDIPFLLAMGIQFIVNAAIHGDAALIVILDLESFETPYLYPRLFSIEIKPLPPTVCDFPFPEPCPATQKNRPFELLSTLSSLFQEKLQLFFGMKIWRSVRHRVQFNTVNGISACYYPELPPTIEYRFDLSQSVVDGLLRVSLLLPPDLEPFNFAPRNLINPVGASKTNELIPESRGAINRAKTFVLLCPPEIDFPEICNFGIGPAWRFHIWVEQFGFNRHSFTVCRLLAGCFQ